MQSELKTMFYISAIVAIVGAVSYQFLVKRIPASLNPFVSVMGIYVTVLVLSVILLVIFPADGGLMKHVRQLSWLQLAIAVAVFMIELGFLLMYRYGWNLSTGNLITGVVINLSLVGLGFLLLGEKITTINSIGIALSIIGVTLISYRS